MKITMRAFLVRDPTSGQVTIYGHSENDDQQNRDDFGELWEPGKNDQHAIIEFEVEIPGPQPIPVAKVSVQEACGLSISTPL